MNQQSYKMLCDDLEQVASELEGQEPACDFSEDETFFDTENYSELWSDRS